MPMKNKNKPARFFYPAALLTSSITHAITHRLRTFARCNPLGNQCCNFGWRTLRGVLHLFASFFHLDDTAVFFSFILI